jgi:Uma2 family endonuclease
MTSRLTPSATEQRLVLEGVSWQQYETLLATLGDDFPNLRLTYLEGTLGIMMTAPEHEELKITLLATYLAAIQFWPVRTSTTSGTVSSTADSIVALIWG